MNSESAGSVWLLCYSPSQRAFHVETLEEACAHNLENIAIEKHRGGVPDYLPVAFSYSRNALSEVADDLACKWRPQ